MPESTSSTATPGHRNALSFAPSHCLRNVPGGKTKRFRPYPRGKPTRRKSSAWSTAPTVDHTEPEAQPPAAMRIPGYLPGIIEEDEEMEPDDDEGDCDMTRTGEGGHGDSGDRVPTPRDVLDKEAFTLSWLEAQSTWNSLGLVDNTLGFFGTPRYSIPPLGAYGFVVPNPHHAAEPGSAEYFAFARYSSVWDGTLTDPSLLTCSDFPFVQEVQGIVRPPGPRGTFWEEKVVVGEDGEERLVRAELDGASGEWLVPSAGPSVVKEEGYIAALRRGDIKVPGQAAVRLRMWAENPEPIVPLLAAASSSSSADVGSAYTSVDAVREESHEVSGDGRIYGGWVPAFGDSIDKLVAKQKPEDEECEWRGGLAAYDEVVPRFWSGS